MPELLIANIIKLSKMSITVKPKAKRETVLTKLNHLLYLMGLKITQI